MFFKNREIFLGKFLATPFWGLKWKVANLGNFVEDVRVPRCAFLELFISKYLFRKCRVRGRGRGSATNIAFQENMKKFY